MPEWAEFIGGLIRWLFKCCKTNLKDELEGNLDPSWGGSYDFENFIIGIFFVAACLGIIVWLIS
jgi:hypothetical protein